MSVANYVNTMQQMHFFKLSICGLMRIITIGLQGLFVFFSGVGQSPLGTAATSGLLY
jgi:hypothetical protein